MPHSPACLIRDKDRIGASIIFEPSPTEDEMRIFERLRGKDRNDSGIERKLAETVLADLLHRIDDEAPGTVVAGAKPNCCSCCSAEAENR